MSPPHASATRAEAKQAQADSRPVGPRRRPRRAGQADARQKPGRSPRRKWGLRALWTALALVVLGVIGRRRRLRADRHPATPNELADGAGVDRLLRRRQDRDGPALRRRGQPRVGARSPKVPEPHAGGACSRRRTGLLPEQRHLARRASRGRSGSRQGRPGDPGRLDDHPAVRQELLPDPGPHAQRKARRSSSRSRSTSSSPRTRSSRTTSTPSTTAAAPTASRPRPRPTSTRTSRSSPPPRAPSSPRSSAGPRSTTRPWATSRRRTPRSARAYILDAMVEKGWLSQAERDKATFPEVPEVQAAHRQSGPTGYLTEMVKNELVDKLKLTDSRHRPRRAADRLHDRQEGKQAAMVKAVKDRAPEGDPGGCTSAWPRSSRATAPSWRSTAARTTRSAQLNAATQDKMQAGSTFKIFTLIAALQSGTSASRRASTAASPQYFEEFADPAPPRTTAAAAGSKNFGDEPFGQHRPAQGHRPLGQHRLRRPQHRRHARRRRGRPRTRRRRAQQSSSRTCANVLGTDYVTVLDMATAYATIAAAGRARRPRTSSRSPLPGRARADLKLQGQDQAAASSTRTSWPTSSTR